VIETLLCRNCHTHLLVIQNWFKNGEWKLTDPCRFHHKEKRPYKLCNCTKKMMSSISGCTLTRVQQTHFRKTETTRNHPHQNGRKSKLSIKKKKLHI
jgi:hypothetical protein